MTDGNGSPVLPRVLKADGTKVAVHRVVQLEAPTVVPLHQSGGDDRLGHRLDMEYGGGGYRHLARQVGVAIPLRPDDLGAPYQRDGEAGDPAPLHLALDQILKLGEHGPLPLPLARKLLSSLRP